MGPNSQLMPLPVAQGKVPAAVPTLPAPRRVSTPTPKLLGTRSYMQLGPCRVSNQTRSGKWLNIWTRTLKKNGFAVGCARFGRWGPNDVNERHANQIDDEHNDGLDVQQNSVINA